MGSKTKLNLKKIDDKLYTSFDKLKEDIFKIRKAKAKNSKELNYLNLRQVALENASVEKSDVHKLVLKLNKLEAEKKRLDDLTKTSDKLKKESLREKEYNKNKKIVSKEIERVKKAVAKLSKKELMIKDEKLKDVENKILTEKDIHKMVKDEISKGYLTADEVFKELDKVKKENAKLYDRVTLIKREILNFQKTKFFANSLIFISLMSFIGAALSLKLSYVNAANFFGIEGFIFLAIGLLIHIVVALKR